MKLLSLMVKTVFFITRKIGLKLFSFIDIFLKPLGFYEKIFIGMNRQFWNDYASRKTGQVGDGYILVNREEYPVIFVGNAQIGSLIALNKNLKLLFLLPSRFNKSMKRVLGSFPRGNFIYEDSLRYLFFKLLSYLQATLALRRFKSPDDILSFTVDGIKFGDLIYDTYLYNGYATIGKINARILFETVASFYYQRSVILDLIKRYKLKLGLTSHNVGIFSAVFVRYLLHNNIEVWERETTVKKFTNMKMAWECCRTPDKRYIDFMRERMDYFLPLAEKCLDDRLKNRNSLVDDQFAYRSEKQIFYSRQELSRSLNLDPNKKNVFVMLHAFNDYPHMYDFLVFRDFYEWMNAVMEIAKKNDSVNWIFKEHPYADFYPTRDLDLPSMFVGIDYPQIRFLRKGASFNTASLRHIADAIVTCIGTAGLEYSSFGVPCVLSGTCWYSGFGFTIEPKTQAEFLKIVDNINVLPRLSEQQVKMAKLLSFFTFEVTDLIKYPDPFGVVPTFNFDEQKTFSSEKIFKCIIERRNSSSAREKDEYLSAMEEFISNKDFIQFVNINKYNFSRSIFSAESTRMALIS